MVRKPEPGFYVEIVERSDLDALVAIEQFFAGAIDERFALSRVDSAKRSNQARLRR